MKKKDEMKAKEIDYESFVVRKAVGDYWRAEEKIELLTMGMSGRIPVTTLCKLNNVSPSLFYEWRENGGFLQLLRRVSDGVVRGLLLNAGRFLRHNR